MRLECDDPLLPEPDSSNPGQPFAEHEPEPIQLMRVIKPGVITLEKVQNGFILDIEGKRFVEKDLAGVFRQMTGFYAGNKPE